VDCEVLEVRECWMKRTLSNLEKLEEEDKAGKKTDHQQI
jgi:hypothetical protein